MSAYMPIFEAIAWVGSQGPELFREVDARRQAEIDAGFKVEGPIVGWLILDRTLIDRHGRNYDSVAADIFAVAELGEIPSIGRRPRASKYVEIPKLSYVGVKIDGGIDGFKPGHSAIIDLFDENWCDVQFLRAEVQRHWPAKRPPPQTLPRIRKESKKVRGLKSFLMFASKNEQLVLGPNAPLFTEYESWCGRLTTKVEAFSRSSFYERMKDYQEGRWS